MASTQRSQFSALFALVALLGTTLEGARAQGTNATCLPGFEWMSNSREQSPCLITAYLNTPCLANPADAYVYSLPTGFHYRPPIPSTATACQCNTIFYSVIQACAVCQGDPIVPWSTWNMNCTSAIYESVYPEAIPAGTSVPAWAYIDVSVSDNFNATAAQLNQQQGHPESTAGGPTPTGPGSQPSQTAPVSGSKKSSNTGAIVGGVVGGLGGAAILAAAAFFFWRRYQRGKYVPKSTTGIAPAIDESTFAPGVVPSDEKHASYQPGYAPVPASSPSPAPGFNGAGIGAGFSPGKVYDPNDPSTFPTAAAEPSLQTAQTATAYNPSSPVLYPSNPVAYQQQYGAPSPVVPAPGQYRGAPEV